MKLVGLWNSRGRARRGAGAIGAEITARDVRALAAQIDAIASNAASRATISALEKRVDKLIDAISIAREAGKALPRDLEKLLVGLVDKLENAQFRHIDDAALAHLEDRVTMLVKRLDAADAKLAHLDAFERGLADLLVHIERMRRVNGGAASASRVPPSARVAERDITRNFSESATIQNGRSTAVAGSRLNGSPTKNAAPPSVADPGKMDFIAAARRALKAATTEPRGQQAKSEAAAAAALRPSVFARAVRKVAFAACLGLIAAGGLRMASSAGLLDEIVSRSAPQAQSPQVSVQPVAPPQTVAQAEQAPRETPPLPTPRPAVAPPPVRGPATKPVGAATPPAGGQPGVGAMPSWAPPEITGALPQPDAIQVPSGPGRSVAIVEDKLPVTIGNAALRAAAIAGDPAAAYEVASRFAEGRGVTLSNEDQAHWLERAAKQGLAPAQFRLGGLYEKGIGVRKDLLRARDLYLAAAQKGNAKAMHNLAVLCAEGASGAPDYESAAAWFRKAADHGVKDSQFNLAVLFARGIGVEQNYAESYKWFMLAANQGDSDSLAKLNEVAVNLDLQTQEAVRLAVQAWSPEPQPDDAVNVKIQAAWETPAEAPHPVRPKSHPAGGETRAADARLN
jgi:localization factor PodJL